MILSSVEEITSEMRRIILRCRSLEAKLEQSVPKKTYQDAVEKMQAMIDRLSEDLTRTTNELSKTETLGGRINSLSATLSSLSSQVASHSDVLKALTEKYSVPHEVYNKSTVRVKELEHELEKKTSETVPKSEFDILQAHVFELEKRLLDSVPREQYSKLVDEISGLISVRSEAILLAELSLTGTKSDTQVVESNSIAQDETHKNEILEIQSTLSQIEGASETLKEALLPPNSSSISLNDGNEPAPEIERESTGSN